MNTSLQAGWWESNWQRSGRAWSSSRGSASRVQSGSTRCRSNMPTSIAALGTMVWIPSIASRHQVRNATIFHLTVPSLTIRLSLLFFFQFLFSLLIRFQRRCRPADGPSPHDARFLGNGLHEPSSPNTVKQQLQWQREVPRYYLLVNTIKHCIAR